MIIIAFWIKNIMGAIVSSDPKKLSFPPLQSQIQHTVYSAEKFIHSLNVEKYYYNIFRSSYGVRFTVSILSFIFLIRFVMYESRNQFCFCWFDCDSFLSTQFCSLAFKIFAFGKCPAWTSQDNMEKGMGFEFGANEQKTQRVCDR